MTPDEQQRYRRNLMVDGYGEEGQRKLATARVCVVGAGGLGSAALLYLAASGLGMIRIIENDIVSLSNLQRQTLYTTSSLGSSKVDAAVKHLAQLNPHCTLDGCNQRLTDRNASTLLAGFDAVIDCSDNYATRYVIDDFCTATLTPMIYGTAEQWGGQVALFHGSKQTAYRTLYPTPPPQKAEVGVLSPIVGIIGSLEALETIKWLTASGSTLDGRLLSIDGHTMQFTTYEI